MLGSVIHTVFKKIIYVVSKPYRYARKFVSVAFVEKSFLVSKPYRYARKFFLLKKSFSFWRTFQNLIGMLGS